MAPRPSVLLPAALALAALVLTACGGSSEDRPAATDSGGGAYPVTITHKLGTTTVEAEPKRVVTLSDVDLDSALSLGVQPVGVAGSIGDDGLTPWSRPKLTTKPTVLEAGDNGFDPEDILALNPDLVLAGGDYYADEDVKNLKDTGIPVVGYENGPAEDGWDTTVRQAAKALGKVQQGEEVVAGVQQQIDQVRADHPELAGKTFSLTQMFEAGSIGVLRSEADSGVKMLNAFGMKLSPSSAALKGDDFAVTLSLEKLGTLESDVLLTYFADPKLQPELQGNKVFSGLGVVERGGFAPLTLEQFSSLRGPTPLSVPYTVQNVVPLLVKAADTA